MSKRLIFPQQQRPQILAPSYHLPTSRNARQLAVPEYDETLLDLDKRTNKSHIKDKGRYAEAFFKVNSYVAELDTDDEYLL